MPQSTATLDTNPSLPPTSEPGRRTFSADDVAASNRYCAAIVKSKAKNFYYGMRLTPSPQRWAMYAVYAWMRYADDLVDDAPDNATRTAAITKLTSLTTAAIGSVDHGHNCAEYEPDAPPQSNITHPHPQSPKPPAHHEDRPQRIPANPTAPPGAPPGAPGSPTFAPDSLWPAFAAAVECFPIRRAWLDAMVDGLREDAEHAGYEDAQSLRRYCYRVGGTVGQVCVAIWGTRQQNISKGQDPYELAASRGRGFQLINIARDVGEDARAGRCYIPRELPNGAGATGHEQRAIESDPAITRWLCQQARAELADSQGLEDLINPQCTASLRAMTEIYTRVLTQLEQSPQLAYQGRARVNTLTKLTIMLRAKLNLL